MNEGESRKIPHVKKNAMIAALSKTGNVTVAAKAAKIDRTTHYQWLREDSDYAASVDDAMQSAADLLEEEARRRAFTGVEEPVFGRVAKDTDGQIGTIRKYSDTLLIFLLKGNKPDKFRERSEVKHTGAVATTQIDLSQLPQSDVENLEAILTRAAENGKATETTGTADT